MRKQGKEPVQSNKQDKVNSDDPLDVIELIDIHIVTMNIFHNSITSRERTPASRGRGRDPQGPNSKELMRNKRRISEV